MLLLPWTLNDWLKRQKYNDFYATASGYVLSVTESSSERAQRRFRYPYTSRALAEESLPKWTSVTYHGIFHVQTYVCNDLNLSGFMEFSFSKIFSWEALKRRLLLLKMTFCIQFSGFSLIWVCYRISSWTKLFIFEKICQYGYTWCSNVLPTM